MSRRIPRLHPVALGLLVGACTGQNTEQISRHSRVADAGRDAQDDAAADPASDGDEDSSTEDELSGDDGSVTESLDAGAASDAMGSALPDAGAASRDASIDAKVGPGTVGDASASVGSEAGLCISPLASDPSAPTSFRLSVYDTISNTPLPGAHVIALDNDTGEPLSPRHEGDTDERGQILFTDMPNDRPFGLKAFGMSNRWIDTYQFGYSTDPNNPRSTGLYVFVAGHENFSAQSGGFTLRPDAGFVRGFIQWKGRDALAASGVGCAAIGGEGLDDVRYTMDQPLARPASERSQAQGTYRTGGYVIGNAAPGRRVITATLPDGSVIGSTSIFVFPRSASTAGLGNVVIGSIFLDGTACESDPTPTSCQ